MTTYVSSGALAFEDQDTVPIVKPDSMGFNPFANRPKVVSEAQADKKTSAPPYDASRPSQAAGQPNSAIELFPPVDSDSGKVAEKTTVGPTSSRATRPAIEVVERKDGSPAFTPFKSSNTVDSADASMGAMIRAAMPVPTDLPPMRPWRARTESSKLSDFNSQTENSQTQLSQPQFSQTEPSSRPTQPNASLSDEANAIAATLAERYSTSRSSRSIVGSAAPNASEPATAATAAPRVPGIEKSVHTQLADETVASRPSEEATIAVRQASILPASDPKAGEASTRASVNLATSIEPFPAVEPAAEVGPRLPTVSSKTPSRVALERQEQISPESESVITQATYVPPQRDSVSPATKVSSSEQFDTSPSDRVVSSTEFQSASNRMSSLAYEQDPIVSEDDLGSFPIQMAPEPQSPMESAIMMDPVTDELFSDPFQTGAPCPGGCPPKIYAAGEWVWYQPEMSTYQISSVARTNQEFFRQGIRATLGFRNDCTYGTEFSFMMLENSREFVDSRSYPPVANLITRFAPQGGLTAANLSSFSGAGLVHRQEHDMEFAQAEFNRVSWGWDVINTFVGIRAVRMNEETIFASSPLAQANNPIGTLPGQFRRELDNLLLGPQIGLTLIDDSRFRWTYDLKLRAGAFANLIDSKTQLINAGSLVFDNEDDTVGFSALGEISTGFSWHMTDNIKIRAGFDALYIYGLATARDQLDYQPAGTVALTPFTGLTTNKEDDIFFWGGTIGVYGNWP